MASGPGGLAGNPGSSATVTVSSNVFSPATVSLGYGGGMLGTIFVQ